MESSALLFNQLKVWICCKKFSSFFNYLCHSWTIRHLDFGWICDLMCVCECVNNLNRQQTHFSCWLVPMWLNPRSTFFVWLLHIKAFFYFYFFLMQIVKRLKNMGLFIFSFKMLLRIMFLHLNWRNKKNGGWRRWVLLYIVSIIMVIVARGLSLGPLYFVHRKKRDIGYRFFSSCIQKCSLIDFSHGSDCSF